ERAETVRPQGRSVVLAGAQGPPVAGLGKAAINQGGAADFWAQGWTPSQPPPFRGRRGRVHERKRDRWRCAQRTPPPERGRLGGGPTPAPKEKPGGGAAGVE